MLRTRVNQGLNLDQFDQQPSDIPGLDTSGNPLLSHFESNYEKNLLLALPITNTDVDWRENNRKPINGAAARQGSTPRRAAYVQQVGISAPIGYACSFCCRGGGPFESCKIAIAHGQLLFNGACGNCSWGAQTHKCSLRSGPLPPHIFNALRAANPDAPALSRGCMSMDEEHNELDEPDESLTPAAPRRSLRSSATKRQRAEEIEDEADKPDEPSAPKPSGRFLRSSATKRRRVEEIEEPDESDPHCSPKASGQMLRIPAIERRRAEESTESDDFDDSDDSGSDESDESSLPKASSRTPNRPTTKRRHAVEIKEEFDEDIDIPEMQRPRCKSTNEADMATVNENSSSSEDTSSADSDSSTNSDSSSDSDISTEEDIAADRNNAVDKGKLVEKGKSAEKSATKGLKYKIPNGPDYPDDLYSTVLLDPRLRGREWPAIRSIRRNLAQLVERLQWEEKVVKAVLEKNGELEGPYESSEEEDDLFAGLNF
ncbi:hypothetical protein N7494_012454 [Penicillium frequentans]|uniref:Uncharacterized protein n=1 Tax=Penicillium frequentans TaxID=3151616 RepID=A0AAD6CLP6_9EURO|nr:hypothetical protein N7494_012454 [Penicillium glabrum]